MDIITLASIVALASVIPLLALIIALIIKTIREGELQTDVRYAIRIASLYFLRATAKFRTN